MILIIALSVLIILFAAVFAYEIWRAPLLEEQKDGSWKTIVPTKKFKDLFKKN
jgi:hypothetical protein